MKSPICVLKAIFVLVLFLSSSSCAGLEGAARTDRPQDPPAPNPSFFTSLPVHLVGETVEAGGYSVTLEEVALSGDRLTLQLGLANATIHPIDLEWAVQLYDPDRNRLFPEPLASSSVAAEGGLTQPWTYVLPAPIDPARLAGYRLLYAPFGWSGPVILFRLSDAAPAPTVTRVAPPMENSYGPTGDPWKMLILVYPNIDTLYVDIDGQTKRLTARMPDEDVANMKADFLNQPHRSVVHDYSDQAAELEAHIVEVARPLSDLAPIGNGYWPSPDTTRPELDAYAPKGKYDSVIVFWQASNPDTGQSIPVNGWGLGYWPFDYANGMTYATVFNIGWIWPIDACRGEVFLHEWLHGVTGFYMSRGFAFPPDDLHGAEAAGYTQDANGCWESWLRDYMRGLVYVNGGRTALVPGTWRGGSITTYNIQGWRGEYFNNETLDGIPVMVRDDPEVAFDWGDASPHPLVNDDNFSVRWTRSMNFASTGIYRFYLSHDGGARLFVDGVLKGNYWGTCCALEQIAVRITAGVHSIRVEMHETGGQANIQLWWEQISQEFVSEGARDGWVLESEEYSNAGGFLNASAATVSVGDSALDRQEQSILSFNTATLPDNAVITSAVLKLKGAGVAGTNPFATHGKLVVDVRTGAFSGNAVLQAQDFQALATRNVALTMLNNPVNGWYSKGMLAANFIHINKTGVTQFRLRFTKDDNDDRSADALKLYSGDAWNAGLRPQLIIKYYVP